MISGLGVGGAERTLQQVALGLDPSRFRSTVVSLGERGVIGIELAAAGIPVVALGLRPGFGAVLGVGRLAGVMREVRPDIVQTWMYHADLLGLLAARRSGRPPLAWNVRSGVQTWSDSGLATGTVMRLCARASRGPNVVVVNSEAGRREHEAIGYRPRGWAIIRNGVDTGRFRPDAGWRARARASLGIADDTFVVGSVGRDHPVKRYPSILRAAAAVRERHPDLALVLVGEGLAGVNRRLTELGRELGMSGRLHLVGPVGDVPRWLSAMDAFISASASEGFPNATAEAMACQVPCVVTDVGDSRALVGEAGVVVGADDQAGLTAGLQGLAAMSAGERARFGEASRDRVVRCYSRRSMLKAYEDLYAGVEAQASRDLLEKRDSA